MAITSPGPPAFHPPITMIAPQSCVMNALVSFMFLFKARAIMRLSTELIPWDAVRWKIPAASSLLTGGKVAHFENDTASEK